jgi:hypothetical protein
MFVLNRVTTGFSIKTHNTDFTQNRKIPQISKAVVHELLYQSVTHKFVINFSINYSLCKSWYMMQNRNLLKILISCTT